jgi:hypothetical protein
MAVIAAGVRLTGLTYVPQYERPLSILVASSTLSVGHGVAPGITNEIVPVGLPMLRSLNGAFSSSMQSSSSKMP